MSILKRATCVAAASMALAVVPAMTASAHVLKEQHDTYVAMHVDPDDNPLSGQPTKILFDFSNNKHAFRLNDCDCQLKITADGQQIVASKVEAAFFGSATKGQAIVTFPKAGVYDLILTGSSKTKDYQDFTLDYPLRVNVGRAATAQTASNDSLAVVIISLMSLAVLAFVAKNNITKSNT